MADTIEQSPFSRRSREAERSREERETKEGEKDPELQAAAAMERADYLVKEVKTSRKQIQNILLHVQQVQQALQALRSELALANEESPSVSRDEAYVESLRQKIATHQKELVAMRDDLIKEQTQMLIEESEDALSSEDAMQKATHMVDAMLADVKSE